MKTDTAFRPRSDQGAPSRVSFGAVANLIRDTVPARELTDQVYIGLEHIGEAALSLVGTGVAGDTKSPKSQFRKSDILFGKLRPYFRKVVRAPMAGVCSTDIWVVRARPGVEQRFLYYVMASPDFVDYAARGSEGTKMPRAKWDFVEEYRFPLPTRREQRATAHVLGTLDDKIALNRRMNETLEAMARAIFKDWFVDFGPTRAKAEGRPPYLPPDLWALFPDTLDDEGKPAGWRLHAASQLIDFNPRESVKKGTVAPYINMAAVPTSGMIPDEPTSRSYGSGSKFRDGDTLFARITPSLENGKTAYVFDLGADVIGTGSTEFVVMRSRPPLPQPVSYLLARDRGFRAHAEQSMTGTSGRQRATVAAMERYGVATPSDQRIWQAVDELVAPMLARVITNARASRGLAGVRDALLPKLISGEIRMSEAERTVEDVA